MAITHWPHWSPSKGTSKRKTKYTSRGIKSIIIWYNIGAYCIYAHRPQFFNSAIASMAKKNPSIEGDQLLLAYFFIILLLLLFPLLTNAQYRTNTHVHTCASSEIKFRVAIFVSSPIITCFNKKMDVFSDIKCVLLLIHSELNSVHFGVANVYDFFFFCSVAPFAWTQSKWTWRKTNEVPNGRGKKMQQQQTHSAKYIFSLWLEVVSREKRTKTLISLRYI